MLLNLCSGTTFPCTMQVKSLHMGPKPICAWAVMRISACEIDTTAPEKARPNIQSDSRMPTLKSCSESYSAPSSASRADDRLTRNRNGPWCIGPEPRSPQRADLDFQFPLAGRARGHHEDHLQSQNIPKEKLFFFFDLSLCHRYVFYCLGMRQLKKKKFEVINSVKRDIKKTIIQSTAWSEGLSLKTLHTASSGASNPFFHVLYGTKGIVGAWPMESNATKLGWVTLFAEATADQVA